MNMNNESIISRPFQMVLISAIIKCNEAEAILMEMLLSSPLVLETIQGALRRTRRKLRQTFH